MPAEEHQPPVIRPASPEDVGLLLGLFRELAEYEKLEDQLHATEDRLHTALFGERPAAEALIAEIGGETAGYALFFPTFSTFLSIQGIWLEDLFVRPEHRGAGVGRALLAAVAGKARERGSRAPGMVGPRLERARPRLLPADRGPADERVDHPPSPRRGAEQAGRGESSGIALPVPGRPVAFAAIIPTAPS